MIHHRYYGPRNGGAAMRSAAMKCALALLMLWAIPGRAQRPYDQFGPVDFSGEVHAIVVLPDGKIIVGGRFFNSTAGNNYGVLRLTSSGSQDPTFISQRIGEYQPVFALAIQDDGKILVGGQFILSGSTPRTNLMRLHADGRLDESFVATADHVVRTLLVLPDRKILVGGSFTNLNGLPQMGIGRLNHDGTTDQTYTIAANRSVLVMERQRNGKVFVGGNFSELGGITRSKLARLNTQGLVDPGFDPGAALNTQASQSVSALAMQIDGKILVGGDFLVTNGTVRSSLIRLYGDGSIDGSFRPNVGAVSAVALQPDGKVLVMASSGRVRLRPNGQLDDTFARGAATQPYVVPDVALQPDGKILLSESTIARLHPDGSPDGPPNEFLRIDGALTTTAMLRDGRMIIGGSFRAGNVMRLKANALHDPTFYATARVPFSDSGGWVNTIVVQEDGAIVLGGRFATVNGETQTNLCRLSGDGTRDASFASANLPVLTSAREDSGGILIGGGFTEVGGQTHSNLARLNVDGSVNMSFNPGVSSNVFALLTQPDGKILIGGDFTAIAGAARKRLARIHRDGTLDLAFHADASNTVRTIVMQADGKILVGGDFTTLGGSPRFYLARVNHDGTLDPTFQPWIDRPVYGASVQLDGKILICGTFSNVTGQARSFLARLHADGTLDTTFDPRPNWYVFSVGIQPDGRLVAGGGFSQMGLSSRDGLARFPAEITPRQAITVDGTGTEATWTRSGSGPEIEQVTFALSTDGTNYAQLGKGMRVVGGWQIGGFSLPIGTPFYIRTRGVAKGGFLNATTVEVEYVQQLYRADSPTIEDLRLMPGGAFRFTMSNTARHDFTVIASSDIQMPTGNWEAVADAVKIADGLYEFKDEGKGESAQRFYQLRW